MDFLNWDKITVLYYTLKNYQENRSYVNYSYNNNKKAQKTYRGDGYSFYLNVVMVSWMYTYVQTHQMSHIKYVYFLYQLYLNKAIFKIKN